MKMRNDDETKQENRCIDAHSAVVREKQFRIPKKIFYMVK